MSHFVNALTIKHWSERLDARGTLPQLMRRLAYGLADATEIDFPAFESAHRSGFDGVIACRAGNSWIPAGKSFWELSVEGGVTSKANSDFEKRSVETPPEVKKQSAFVFVTPRFWKGKDSWIEKKSREGGWKEVRAYDCDDLEQWIESTLPVAIWFGQQLGTRPEGVDTLSERWIAIANSGRHQLVPSIFLAGRESNIESIKLWMSGKPNWLAVSCRSPYEVIDFVCAWSASLAESERLSIESRSILIEDLNAWKRLRGSLAVAILIVDPSIPLSAEEIRRAVSSGHRVLLATEPSSDQPNTIELKRPEECGYSHVEAEQLARSAGGSLAVLKKRLAEPRISTAPSWSTEIPTEVIATCLLLGGWKDTNTADVAAFERLSGRSYAECEAKLQWMSSARDSLLLHADHKWRLISKDDAWTVFGDTVPPSQIKEFELLATEILTDNDPRFDLPEEERPCAQLAGHVSKYSNTIKQHIAETLSLLGSIGNSLEASVSIDVTAAVDSVVGSVLSQTSTWHRWASLGGHLPLLAEASPRVFLAAVRADLQKSDPELVKLLPKEEGSIFFSNCNQAGLLWALENLAWSTLYVGEVAEALLVLSRDDPGGRWINRPINSLTAILSWWLPQTTANCGERIQILDLLIQQHREAAWSMLLKLMPDPVQNTADPTHRPFWRDWANNWSNRTTFQERTDFVTAVCERIIEQAGVEVARWVQVFKRLGQFPVAVQSWLTEQAAVLTSIEMTDHQRLEITDVLSDRLGAYRHPRHASDSVPAEFLDGIESLLEQLKPRDEAMKAVPLFKKWPSLYLDRNGGYEENQAALRRARVEAIRIVVESEGFDGIRQLLERAESPYDVGNCFAEATEDRFLEEILPEMLEVGTQTREFANGFIWNRRYHGEWTWMDHALDLCLAPTNKSSLLAAAPFVPDAWERAEIAGEEVSARYWAECRPFTSELDAVSIERAGRSLVRHDRVPEAIDHQPHQDCRRSFAAAVDLEREGKDCSCSHVICRSADISLASNGR